MRRLVLAVGVLVTILLLAAVRDVVAVEDDQVVFRPHAVVSDVTSYVRGLVTGESFVYGRFDDRSFFSSLDVRVITSFLYMAASGLLAVFLGPSVALWLTAGRRDRLGDAISSMGAIPDFVLALLLQIAVVMVYKATGVRLAHVATIEMSRPAILLPVLVLTLVPTLYLVRSVSALVHDVTTEPYITAAKARGAGRSRIYAVHVLPNVTAFLKADLAKVTSIILADFFIIDYLFNLRGITTLLFYYGLEGGQQHYSLMVNSMVVMVVLYAAVFALLRGFVSLVQAVAVRL